MEKKVINYETMLKVAKAISHSKDPEEVALMKTNELELATSFGLSDEYLNKGPVSALRSIAQSLEDGPVAIYDVMDDPRIQYPKEAQKEGISSILSVPIVVGGSLLGAVRVYTSEPWEFTLDDVNFMLKD
jgi:GAF domain-containing protein